MDLDEVGDKKPKNEGRIWVETQGRRSNNVVAEPKDSPNEDNEEKTHGADFVGNDEG